MSDAQVTARGTINVIGAITGGNGVVISNTQIKDRAFRRCPAGYATCGFTGVDISSQDSSGTVTVATLCQNSTSCQTSDVSLQIGLDRLRVAAPSSVTQKSKGTA